MTRYIAAFDTESSDCPRACRRIVEMLRRHEMPATFFIVGRIAEQHAAELKPLLTDPGYEVASHSWSHRVLLEHPFNTDPLPTHEQGAEEVIKGKQAIEAVFERPCPGLRLPWCFESGLVGQGWLLDVIARAGHTYVSSQAWGPHYSLPAPPRLQAFTYAQDGFPQLWELPAHGWHENVLKNHNGWGPRRVTLWPPEIPQAIPVGFVTTPEEEVAVNRAVLENAVSIGAEFVSLVWHPWSLHRFDPEMRMLDLTFRLVRDMGLTPCTYSDLRRVLGAGPNRSALR